MTFHVPEHCRVRNGAFASSAADGNNGAFFVRKAGKPVLKVLASCGEGWEHVSVSLPDRCPTWEEMCRIVAIFWDEDDCVMQLHPPRANWVSNHTYCLHLWRPIGVDIPQPPTWMVGYQDLGDVHKGGPALKAVAFDRWLEANTKGPEDAP